MNYEELYKDLEIPFLSIGSGKLVKRSHAVKAIKEFYRSGLDLLGYDAFTVSADGRRKPHMELSASFSKVKRTEIEAIESLQDDPVEVTHYEFVVRPRT